MNKELVTAKCEPPIIQSGQRRGSGSLSSASISEGPGLMVGKTMWDLWWTHNTGHVSIRKLSFSP